jgi:hypothetical protein
MNAKGSAGYSGQKPVFFSLMFALFVHLHHTCNSAANGHRFTPDGGRQIEPAS